MNKTNRKIAIVIPFLNERENLPVLYERLSAVAENLPEQLRFIFVDDGSSDGGFEWLEKKGAQDPRVGTLRLSRNFGHQAAITAGLDRAKGDASIVMDADLQDPPEIIPELLSKWREGAEVVYAVRRERQGESYLKKISANLFYRLFRKLVSIDVPLNSGDFRLLDKRVVEALRGMRETHRYMRAMTSWVGFRQASVEYDRQARQAGKTKYPFWKSLKLAWDGVTSFSGIPLRLLSGMGFFICLVALIWLIKILLMHWINPATQEPGWASVMVALLMLGGVQLIAIGLLGQYLSRTFEESKKRPLYIVRSDSLKEESQGA